MLLRDASRERLSNTKASFDPKGTAKAQSANEIECGRVASSSFECAVILEVACSSAGHPSPVSALRYLKAEVSTGPRRQDSPQFVLYEVVP